MDGLNYVIELLKNKNNNLFSKLYAFTTENISGYYNKLSFENKKVLTVTASGDQAINAILFGSKQIDCFDSNPLASYYTNLKIAAIKNLEKQEFLEYFSKNDNSLNPNSYLKIRNDLSADSRFFWDSMYNQLKPLKIRELLFNDDEYNLQKIIEFNPYLQNYELLKQRIVGVTINYYNCDITELPNILTQKYDTIILSNIMQYSEYIYEKESLFNFKKLLQSLSIFLKLNGKIMCGYLYNFEYNNDEYKNKKQIFNPSEYEYLQINGTNDKDGIILFNK